MSEKKSDLVAEISNPKFAWERTNAEPSCCSQQSCQNCIFDGDCEIQKTESKGNCKCNITKHVPNETANIDEDDNSVGPHPDAVVCPSPAREEKANRRGTCCDLPTNVEDCEQVRRDRHKFVPDTNTTEVDSTDADVKEALIHCKMLKGEIPSNLVLNPENRKAEQFKVDSMYAGIPNDKVWNYMCQQDTMNYGELPRMSDKVKDFTKPDAENTKVTVGDIYEEQLKEYARVNAGHKIKGQCDPSNPCKAAEKPSPEKSLLKLCNDMPSKMVDKIITTPAEYWEFDYDNGNYLAIRYEYGTRSVIIRICLDVLKDQADKVETTKPLMSFTFHKTNEAVYTRDFNSLKELYDGPINIKRFYGWLGRLIGRFFK